MRKLFFATVLSFLMIENIHSQNTFPTSGNVGIGTNTPTSQLHTTGSVKLAGLTNDTTKTRMVVSDNLGGLFYRDIQTLPTNGLSLQGQKIGLGGNLVNANTDINLKGNYLNINVNDATTTGIGTGGLNILAERNNINSDNNLYVSNIHTGGSMVSGAASLAAETFWHSPSAVTAGDYANYASIHKSNITGTNMSGTTLYGFQSIFYANQPNQQFGNIYHFYVNGNTSYQPTVSINNHMGLYISQLSGTNTLHPYAIYTAGSLDTVLNAGPVRLTKYLNNSTGDSVLVTDIKGNLKQRFISSGATRWTFATNKIYDLTDSVGIGTSNNYGYKLAVNGSAIFTKVVVKNYNVWPDFVFSSSYKLQPLQSLEKYILENKHLPDVPSADEVRDSGLDLSNNQAALLQKIEELTLYVIGQNKKFEKQQVKDEKLFVEISALKNENKELKNRIEKIENKN